MTVLVPSKNLLVTTSPKVACTSIKTAMFRVENGFGFTPFDCCGGHRSIHHPSIYPALDFSSAERMMDRNKIDRATVTKFTVVRDPVQRFLSAYSNRVVYYRDMERECAQNAEIREQFEAIGLPVVPDLEMFIHNLEFYFKFSPTIRLHTLPQTYFVGSDSSFYTGIFSVNRIGAFEAAISDFIGSEFKLEQLQTGGQKINPDTLGKAQLTKLNRVYSKDIEVLSRFF